jgi:hypothetical protein
MTAGNLPISWKVIVRGVSIVYGVTFVSGLVLAFNGITPQIDPVAYPLLALLTGAVGVAVALRVAETTRPSYLLAIGVGVWLLSLTNVLLGAQSFTGWVSSSAFNATTIILGRLLVGISLDRVPTLNMPYSLINQKRRSAVQKHRARPSRLSRQP